VEIRVMIISTTTKNRRRSTISASAPAGKANRNIGKLVATCTMETMMGSGLRLAINQPEAALYIHDPMLEARVAIQTTVNVLWRNALQGEVDFACAAGAGAG
jgi:hypothetical protein